MFFSKPKSEEHIFNGHCIPVLQKNTCKLEGGKIGLCCADVNPIPAKNVIGTR